MPFLSRQRSKPLLPPLSARRYSLSTGFFVPFSQNLLFCCHFLTFLLTYFVLHDKYLLVFNLYHIYHHEQENHYLAYRSSERTCSERMPPSPPCTSRRTAHVPQRPLPSWRLVPLTRPSPPAPLTKKESPAGSIPSGGFFYKLRWRYQLRLKMIKRTQAIASA